MGVVDNLLDPQQEHNKTRSQTLHILNSTANTGWIVGKLKGLYGKVLETMGSKPGVIIEKSKCGDFVEKITPNPIPAGHFTMSEVSANDMKDISSVDADLQGHSPNKEESGRSRYLRQQQGMTASGVLFDNFRYSRQIFSQFLVELIRRTDYYSETEVRAILDESSAEVSMEELQDFKVGRYGIKIDQSPDHPTTRMMNYELLVNAVKDAGLPIDPKFIIQASDLPNKDEIIADLEMKMQMMMQQQQMQLQTGGGQ